MSTGERLVNHAARALGVDDKWADRGDDFINWIPHRTVLTLDVTTEADEDRDGIVSAVTLTAEAIAPDAGAPGLVNRLNSSPPMGPFVYEPDATTLAVYTRLPFSNDRTLSTSRTLSLAAAAQISTCEDLIDQGLLQALGADILNWDPVGHGPREQPHPVVGFYRDQETDGQVWVPSAVWTEVVERRSRPTDGSSCSIAAAHGDPGGRSVHLRGAGIVRVEATYHGGLGPGLSFTSYPGADQLPSLDEVAELNRAYACDKSVCIGAWHVGPAGLTFRTFLPAGVYLPLSPGTQADLITQWLDAIHAADVFRQGHGQGSDTREIELASRSDEDGLRTMRVRLTGDGVVEFFGHDMGPGVQDFFGMSVDEYEYALRLQPKAVDRLMDVLGEQNDVLAAIAKHVDEDTAFRLRTWLDEHDIEYEFWSHRG